VTGRPRREELLRSVKAGGDQRVDPGQLHEETVGEADQEAAG
jgi:hypothetical protein